MPTYAPTGSPQGIGRYLHVPFEEKDRAKALGARWDTAKRSWYVPEGVSEEAFSQWFDPRPVAAPSPPDFSGIGLNTTILSPAIAESSVECWSCKAETPVLAIVGLLDGEDGRPPRGVRGIKAFDPEMSRMLAAYPHYRLAFSKTTKEWSFCNVCACGALQGDFFLHSEPDGPFFWPEDPDNPCVMTRLKGAIQVARPCGRDD